MFCFFALESGLGSRIVYSLSADVMVLLPILGSSKLLAATKAIGIVKKGM